MVTLFPRHTSDSVPLVRHYGDSFLMYTKSLLISHIGFNEQNTA